MDPILVILVAAGVLVGYKLAEWLD